MRGKQQEKQRTWPSFPAATMLMPQLSAYGTEGCITSFVWEGAPASTILCSRRLLGVFLSKGSKGKQLSSRNNSKPPMSHTHIRAKPVPTAHTPTARAIDQPHTTAVERQQENDSTCSRRIRTHQATRSLARSLWVNDRSLACSLSFAFSYLRLSFSLTVVIEEKPVESPVRVGGDHTVAVGARREGRAETVHAVQRGGLVRLELADLHLPLRQPEDNLVRPGLRPRHARDGRRLRELVADALALDGMGQWVGVLKQMGIGYRWDGVGLWKKN